MKITEYPSTKELSTTDEFLVGGPNSTKKISGEDFFLALDEISTEEPWVAHRNHFRGKNLGSEFTAEQKAAIRDGSFKDLWVGDYWVNGYTKWRIADINYWLNKGDDVNDAVTTNHLVIVPDNQLYTSSWSDPNDSNAITNGYNGSYIRTTGLTQAKQMYKTMFGEESILTHKICICNAITNGVDKGNIVVDSDVDIMSEIMVYGCHIKSNPDNVNTTLDIPQLSLFTLNPSLITSSNYYYYYYWLRENYSHFEICCVGKAGWASKYAAKYTLGVRPAAAIG